MKNTQIAEGRVESLSINGSAVQQIWFNLNGPLGDKHTGPTRQISGHDSAYRKTSHLAKGDTVFNWRSWTAISTEETSEVEKELGVLIPQGCLLENMVVSGILNFSQLPPTSRLVFPQHGNYTRAILAVWEENGPCKGVGERLQNHYQLDGLCTRFINAAQHKRGVMGLVLSAGLVEIGDVINVYGPAE